MRAFPPETEQLMKTFYDTLNEKDRRRYAAVEAIKMGHGGRLYISQILGCDRSVMTKAILELQQSSHEELKDPAIRKKGGGRKTIEEKYPEIDQAFLEVLKHHTAGDPQDEKLIWTNLTIEQIIEKLALEHQIKVSNTVIYKLLKKHGFKRKKAQKKDSHHCTWSR